MSTFGERPLTVGADVIRGKEVLLSEKTSDKIDEVSKDTGEELETKAGAEETLSVELVTATATCCNMAASESTAAIVELPEVFRKQFEIPESESV